jgi:hypothetical protein
MLLHGQYGQSGSTPDESERDYTPDTVDEYLNMVNLCLPDGRSGEEWGYVSDFFRYWVSSHGRVYGGPKITLGAGGTNGGLMSPADNGSGYEMVTLKKDGESKGRTVHSLVMEVHGPDPPGSSYIINHIDGNRQNNHLDNLEWVTRAENSLHGAVRNVAENQSAERVFQLVEKWLDAPV